MMEVYFTCFWMGALEIVTTVQNNKWSTINSTWWHSTDLQGELGIAGNRTIHIHEMGREKNKFWLMGQFHLTYSICREKLDQRMYIVCIQWKEHGNQTTIIHHVDCIIQLSCPWINDYQIAITVSLPWANKETVVRILKKTGQKPMKMSLAVNKKCMCVLCLFYLGIVTWWEGTK